MSLPVCALACTLAALRAVVAAAIAFHGAPRSTVTATAAAVALALFSSACGPPSPPAAGVVNASAVSEQPARLASPAPVLPPHRSRFQCARVSPRHLGLGSRRSRQRRQIRRKRMGRRSCCPYPLRPLRLGRPGPSPLPLSCGMVCGPTSSSLGAALARRLGELLSPPLLRPSSQAAAANGRPQCRRL